MRILERANNYTVAKKIRELGVYPYFRPIESDQDTQVMINGKSVLMMGSNNYLGLANHPEVKEAAIQAVKKFGAGCAGSRFLNGTLSIHLELEEELAEFVNCEAALLYTTGFQVNQGVISSLVGRENAVIIDRTDHASIIDGARLSFGKTFKYEHNDMESLRRTLNQLGSTVGLIVIDGVFSMEGDIARLDEIVKLAQEFNCDVMVDDAHSLGVLGPGGRGTSAHFGIEDSVDLIMGTFSKSLASIGGFVAGDFSIIDYLKHHSRALIFSASPPPASVAAAQTALHIMQREPERIDKLWENTRYLWKCLRDINVDIGKTQTPIVPIRIGEIINTFTACRLLQDNGVFVNPVVAPAVPIGDGLIRLSVMSTHTFEQIEFAVEIIEKVLKMIDLNQSPEKEALIDDDL